MITRSPIRAWVIETWRRSSNRGRCARPGRSTAPAPITVPAPISARGPITAPRIDRDAAFEHARSGARMRAGRHAARLEQRGRPQRVRKQACARPRRKRDRAARTTSSATCGQDRPANRSVVRQAPAPVVAASSAYLRLVEKGEIAWRRAIERGDSGDPPVKIGAAARLARP